MPEHTKIVNSSLIDSRNAGHAGNWTVAAIVAAGGSGTRINADVPKQFLKVAGKPILLHTIENILSLKEVVQIVIALPSEHIPVAEAMLQQLSMRVEVRCTPGGSTRQESVHKAIVHTRRDANIIMVHDAVRPLCDPETMLRVLDAAEEKGAAVPGLPATETIQRVSRKGRILATPPRQELYAIQTPQAFHAGILKSALEQARDAGFSGTDESSIVRWAGHQVTVVPGSPDNIKITHPMDLAIAEILLSKEPREMTVPEMRQSDFRIGQGIDYHRLVEGRTLILGGIEIPYAKGLEGHSDADVVSHAVCDALLGAAGLGDIGWHFPDTDPAHQGRSSLDFLREVQAKIEAAGWAIRNVDATLILQQPKIARHIFLMKQAIAEALGINTAAVNVKATTTEGMNAEGRGEGISAHAVALLYKK